MCVTLHLYVLPKTTNNYYICIEHNNNNNGNINNNNLYARQLEGIKGTGSSRFGS
jgi:negative regulator of genetic competence, sporulation and motility